MTSISSRFMPANPATRQRVFFALWPDEETAEHLHALAGNLVEHGRGGSHRGNHSANHLGTRSRGHHGGRVVAEHDLHLTLAFVGSVDSSTLDQLCVAASELALPAVSVRLDKLGFWPRGGVVYAGCHDGDASRDLLRLMRSVIGLLDTLHLPHDHRSLSPHVSLARNVRGIDLPRLGTPFHWQARTFALVRSVLQPSGARYETLAEWPLLEAGEGMSGSMCQHTTR